MSKALTYGYGKELSDILGIPNITDVDLHFPLDGLISADVKFLLTPEQVEKLLGHKQTAEEMKTALRKVLNQFNG